MPAPVTHVMLALIVLPFLPDKDKKEFIIGTSFPDIRYISGIDRKTTHLHATWNDIVKEPSSFKAGLYFHSLVDQLHADYVDELDLYRFIPLTFHKEVTFKLCEDIMLYSHVADWNLIAPYFDTLLNEELGFGVKQEDVERWHIWLKNYFSKPPTLDRMLQILESYIETSTNKKDSKKTDQSAYSRVKNTARHLVLKYGFKPVYTIILNRVLENEQLRYHILEFCRQLPTFLEPKRITYELKAKH